MKHRPPFHMMPPTSLTPPYPTFPLKMGYSLPPQMASYETEHTRQAVKLLISTVFLGDGTIPVQRLSSVHGFTVQLV